MNNYLKINKFNYPINKNNKTIKKKFKIKSNSVNGFTEINLYENKNIINNNDDINIYNNKSKFIKKSNIEYKDGSSYNGYIINNKYNGFGIYKTKNNIKYEGNWINGKMNGSGKLFINKKLIYSGNFKNNYFHGFGILKNYNNEIDLKFDWNIYKGFFENNFLQPIGELILNDNTTFVGEFKKSKINGIGYFINKDIKKFSIFLNNKIIKNIN